MKIKITNPNYDCMVYGFEIGDILDATIYNSEFYKVTNNGSNYLIHKNTACEYAQIKEKYMKDKENAEFIEKITPRMEVDIEAMEKIKGLNNKHKINQAITLLQSNGYTLTSPYIPPTDDEICERIRVENEKARHFADWNNLEEGKFFIYFDNNLKDWDYDFKKVVEILGTPYTTQSIAKQIIAELNEKRFVRV